MINTSNDLHEFYRDKIDDMIAQKGKLNVLQCFITDKDIVKSAFCKAALKHCIIKLTVLQ